jgi:hypothetical protein
MFSENKKRKLNNNIHLFSNDQYQTRLNYIINMNNYDINIFKNNICKYSDNYTNCTKNNCKYRHLYDPTDKDIYESYFTLKNKIKSTSFTEIHNSQNYTLMNGKKSLDFLPIEIKNINEYLCGYHDIGGFHFNYISSCRDYPFCKLIHCNEK